MRRRVISICLPYLAAEHHLRLDGQTGLSDPYAVIEHAKGTQRLAGVNAQASAKGLSAGMGLTDARAICPDLRTAMLRPQRLQAFVCALARWAERFSPLTGLDEADALVIDATGCAHLFGGEEAMLSAIISELAGLGLTARAAIADAKGAAWALAQFSTGGIAPEGRLRSAIAGLPVAALRIDAETVERLGQVGLTTIEPLTRMPRGALARRFGIECMRRLDQALGAEPEPISPNRSAPRFSVRMTLAEPVGLVSDVMAGLERLLERLCQKLELHQHGARTLRLTVRRVDGADQGAEISLARPGRDPMRLRDLFERKVSEIQSGFGIDALRLEAVVTEVLKPAQMTQAHRATAEQKLTDLISLIGNRVGFENVTRAVPAESHIPERAFLTAPAAYSASADWSAQGRVHPRIRPISMMSPQPVNVLAESVFASQRPPASFQVLGSCYQLSSASGAERLAPEWWWDDPDWRSGPRDYWQVETCEGPRFWLFHTPAAQRPGWFLHGTFS
ncbi:MAG: DNA polymerase Y family protein [Pseudomonadota bacterium]